jgi:hypothetical protein
MNDTQTTTGLVTDIGDVDIAPAARDGQPVIAVWAGESDQPALLDLRTALTLAARLPRMCEQAIDLAAAQL